MRQIKTFSDARLLAHCVYCRGIPNSRDHVPSKVLLDKPYPEQLPFVPACESCNTSFSKHETYVACLIECTISGSVDPADIGREKVRRILEKRPALASRLNRARKITHGEVTFAIEEQRVRRVMLKLARGHAAYELSEPQLAAPSVFAITPLSSLAREQREVFERPPQVNVWPEIGSRAMHRFVAGDAGWITMQHGRYRYLATADSVVTVRIVLSEYLACEAVWNR